MSNDVPMWVLDDMKSWHFSTLMYLENLNDFMMDSAFTSTLKSLCDAC